MISPTLATLFTLQRFRKHISICMHSYTFGILSDQIEPTRGA